MGFLLISSTSLAVAGLGECDDWRAAFPNFSRTFDCSDTTTIAMTSTIKIEVVRGHVKNAPQKTGAHG